MVQANDSIVTGKIIWKLSSKQIHNIEEVPRNNKFISNSCPTSPAHRIVIPQKLGTHEEQLVNKDLRNSDIMTTENKRIVLENPDNLKKCDNRLEKEENESLAENKKDKPNERKNEHSKIGQKKHGVKNVSTTVDEFVPETRKRTNSMGPEGGYKTNNSTHEEEAGSNKLKKEFLIKRFIN